MAEHAAAFLDDTSKQQKLLKDCQTIKTKPKQLTGLSPPPSFSSTPRFLANDHFLSHHHHHHQLQLNQNNNSHPSDSQNLTAQIHSALPAAAPYQKSVLPTNSTSSYQSDTELITQKPQSNKKQLHLHQSLQAHKIPSELSNQLPNGLSSSIECEGQEEEDEPQFTSPIPIVEDNQPTDILNLQNFAQDMSSIHQSDTTSSASPSSEAFPPNTQTTLQDKPTKFSSFQLISDDKLKEKRQSIHSQIEGQRKSLQAPPIISASIRFTSTMQNYEQIRNKKQALQQQQPQLSQQPLSSISNISVPKIKIDSLNSQHTQQLHPTRGFLRKGSINDLSTVPAGESPSRMLQSSASNLIPIRKRVPAISSDPIMNQASAVLINKTSDQRGPDDIETLQKAMRWIPFFKKIERKTHLTSNICRAMTFQYFPKGRVVFYKGDFPDHFFITLKGKVSVLVPKKPQEMAADEAALLTQWQSLLVKDKYRFTISKRLLYQSQRKAFIRLSNILYFIRSLIVRQRMQKSPKKVRGSMINDDFQKSYNRYQQSQLLVPPPTTTTTITLTTIDSFEVEFQKAMDIYRQNLRISHEEFKLHQAKIDSEQDNNNNQNTDQLNLNKNNNPTTTSTSHNQMQTIPEVTAPMIINNTSNNKKINKSLKKNYRNSLPSNLNGEKSQQISSHVSSMTNLMEESNRAQEKEATNRPRSISPITSTIFKPVEYQPILPRINYPTSIESYMTTKKLASPESEQQQQLLLQQQQKISDLEQKQSNAIQNQQLQKQDSQNSNIKQGLKGFRNKRGDSIFQIDEETYIQNRDNLAQLASDSNKVSAPIITSLTSLDQIPSITETEKKVGNIELAKKFQNISKQVQTQRSQIRSVVDMFVNSTTTANSFRFYAAVKKSVEQKIPGLSCESLENAAHFFQNNVFKYNHAITSSDGYVFGELGILNKKPRSATIVCLEDCYFGTLSLKKYEQILMNEENASLAKKRIFIMGTLTSNIVSIEKMSKISYYFHKRKFQAGEFIFREGEPATHIFLVKKGEVELQKEESVQLASGEVIRATIRVAKLMQREYFGDCDIFYDRPRYFSATATSSTTVFACEKVQFLKCTEEAKLFEDQFGNRIQTKQEFRLRVIADAIRTRNFLQQNLDSIHHNTSSPRKQQQQQQQQIQQTLSSQQKSLQQYPQIQITPTDETSNLLNPTIASKQAINATRIPIPQIPPFSVTANAEDDFITFDDQDLSPTSPVRKPSLSFFQQQFKFQLSQHFRLKSSRNEEQSNTEQFLSSKKRILSQKNSMHLSAVSFNPASGTVSTASNIQSDLSTVPTTAAVGTTSTTTGQASARAFHEIFVSNTERISRMQSDLEANETLVKERQKRGIQMSPHEEYLHMREICTQNNKNLYREEQALKRRKEAQHLKLLEGSKHGYHRSSLSPHQKLEGYREQLESQRAAQQTELELHSQKVLLFSGQEIEVAVPGTIGSHDNLKYQQLFLHKPYNHKHQESIKPSEPTTTTAIVLPQTSILSSRNLLPSVHQKSESSLLRANLKIGGSSTTTAVTAVNVTSPGMQQIPVAATLPLDRSISPINSVFKTSAIFMRKDNRDPSRKKSSNRNFFYHRTSSMTAIRVPNPNSTAAVESSAEIDYSNWVGTGLSDAQHESSKVSPSPLRGRQLGPIRSLHVNASDQNAKLSSFLGSKEFPSSSSNDARLIQREEQLARGGGSNEILQRHNSLTNLKRNQMMNNNNESRIDVKAAAIGNHLMFDDNRIEKIEPKRFDLKKHYASTKKITILNHMQKPILLQYS